MKHYRIFGIVFLVAVLPLPLDVFACADLETARDAAQQALDTAEEELQALRLQLGLVATTILGPGTENTPVGNPPTSDPPLDGDPLL